MRICTCIFMNLYGWFSFVGQSLNLRQETAGSQTSSQASASVNKQEPHRRNLADNPVCFLCQTAGTACVLLSQKADDVCYAAQLALSDVSHRRHCPRCGTAGRYLMCCIASIFCGATRWTFSAFSLADILCGVTQSTLAALLRSRHRLLRDT